MRKVLAILLLVSTACSGSGQELAPTQPPETVTPSTTSTSLEAAETTVSTPDTTVTSTAATTTTVAPTTTTTIVPLQALEYVQIGSFEQPIQLVPRNEAESLLATKAGRIHWFVDGEIEDEPVLDLSGRVRNEGERGLLSIAVHPDDDGRLFVHYSASDGDTLVEEYAISEDGAIATEPVRQLLRLDQPARNHNGGMLQFDQAGDFLYLGLGDGGGSGDRYGNGQNTETLLGGLVRLAVDDPDTDPTLFQYGLRNPWRFSIDGDLIYVADVGQNAYEEVSVVPLESDINHGWPVTEGLHCYSPSSGCDTAGITLPVIEVAHGDAGTCSITGGYVYRGTAIPELDGHYLYSDYCGGYLRSFRHEDGIAVELTDWTEQVGVVGRVLSFGIDHEGELYLLTDSAVFKIVPVRSQ